MFDNSSVQQSEINIMTPEPRKEGCQLIEIKPNDDFSVTFTFQDSKKNILGHREFMPKKLDQMTEEDFKKNIKLTIGRVAHISRAFLTEQEWLQIKVDDPNNMAKIESNWKEYVKKTIVALGTKYKGVPCALKVVVRKSKDKYYSSLPQVPPFISTANHPKDFTINEQYDMFTIPKLSPDTEKAPQGGAMPNAAEAFASQGPSEAGGIPAGW